MKPPVLIVNADDFGLARCVNRGVGRAHAGGILTSATLLANGPAFDDAVRLARSLPSLGVGVHLNLVRGRPVLPVREIPDLVEAGGRFDFPGFLRKMNAVPARARRDELARQAEAEYAAQIARVKAAGLAPTHVDAEQHHWRHGFLRVCAARAARREGVAAMRRLREPVAWSVRRMGWPGWGRAVRAAWLRASTQLSARRLPEEKADGLLGQTHIGRMTAGPWRRLLSRPPPGVYEVMTHPGEYDEAEMASLTSEIGASWIHAARPAELAALCDPSVRALADNVRLATYADPKAPESV